MTSRFPLPTVLVTSAAIFMVSLDNLVVTNALASIRADLGASLEALEGTVNAYTLAFAVFLLTHIIKKPGRKGRKLEVRKLVKAIEATVADPRAARKIRPGTRKLVPDVRTKELKRVYRTIITIDRDHFRLRLFKKLHIAKRYGVAVGMPAYPTPTGLFHIQSKQVNPTWTAPNSPWAGELAGQSISGDDPTNPLKARWMGVNGSVGIHGTGEPWTIGSRASHGCIRMTVPDVIDLFGRVDVGTPVLIAP